MGKRFNIISIDPPWEMDDKNTGGGKRTSGASAKYKTLPLQELVMLPISKIAADDCVLFMWYLSSMPEEAIKCCKAWGFRLRNINGFVWVKKTKNDKLHMGMGHSSRACSESCLIGIKGHPKRVDASIQAVIEAIMPVGENGKYMHSAKPDLFLDKMVYMYGDLPRIDIFARDTKPGWVAIGNEITGNDIRKDLYDLVGGDDREKLLKMKGKIKCEVKRERKICHQE